MEPSKNPVSGMVAIISVALVLMLAGAAAYVMTSSRANSNHLQVWEENCGFAYNGFGSMCLGGWAINVPTSFQMSSIVNDSGIEIDNGTTTTTWTGQAITLHDVDLGVVLARGENVLVTVSSNAPVDFSIYSDDRSAYDVGSLRSEVANFGRLLINSVGITSYDQSFKADEGGLYVFELSVSQPRPIATVTFDIQNMA